MKEIPVPKQLEIFFPTKCFAYKQLVIITPSGQESVSLIYGWWKDTLIHLGASINEEIFKESDYQFYEGVLARKILNRLL